MNVAGQGEPDMFFARAENHDERSATSEEFGVSPESWTSQIENAGVMKECVMNARLTLTVPVVLIVICR